MDITQQQYMIALAETGSLTKAAEKLGVSQPAISNWLKSIEEQFHTKLVIRSRHGLVLTQAGIIYLEASQKMRDIRNQTYWDIRRIANEGSAVVTIAGTPNGGAELFARIYHDLGAELLSLELKFVESYNRSSINMVRQEKADLALATIAGNIGDYGDDIEYIETNRHELMLAVPYGFPTSYDASAVKSKDLFPKADLSKLADLPFIMPNEEISYHDVLIRWFRQKGYSPNAVFRSASTKSIYNMIRSGNGIGIVQRRFFSPLDRVSPFSLDPPIQVFSAIIYKKGRDMSPEFLALLNKLCKILKH